MPNVDSTALPSLRTHRLAVLLLFAVNGFLYASWAARVPALQEQYGVGDAQFGFVLICASGGAFLSMPFAAYVNGRFGVIPVTVTTAIAYSVAVALMPWFGTAALIYPIFFLMGISFGLLDVAMNAQAVEVERAYGKAIMSSFHAGFSGAMIGGALIGSAVIWLGLPFTWHLGLAAVIAVAMTAWATPRLYPHVSEGAEDASGDESAFRLPVPATYLLGFVGLCAMMSEASISDWTAKYMLEVAGSARYMAPWSLAAFSIMMTVGRSVGDDFRNRYGDPLLLRGGAILAFLGMAVTIAYPSPWSTILGAALVGSGLSIAVPIVFSLSGRIPGLSASAALAMVTTISYLGLFMGPAIIGFLAEAFGSLRIGYTFILGMLGVLVVAVWRVRE